MRVRVFHFHFLLSVAAIAFAGAALAVAQGDNLVAIEAFNSPMAAEFASDGRTLYVVNGARGDYGMIAGRGSISKCTVSDDGELKVDVLQFTTDLNAPVDIAILPTATSVSPAGSLVVAVGGSWTTDHRGRTLDDDRARGTGLIIADASSGEVLGRLFLGEGSAIQGIFGRPIMDPFSVAADSKGNIYLADYAARGTLSDSPNTPQPGIWKLTPAAIEALLKETQPPAGSTGFFPVRAVPAGLVYSSQDDALYFVTGVEGYDLAGALLRLPRGDFTGAVQLDTVAKELGSLTGIGITPKGTILVARNSGEIVVVRGRRGRPVNFRDKNLFLSPGQLATTSLANGRTLVVVPEASGGGSRPWQHRVRTFILPGNT
ncbi:MAG TPA: hypothetical protein VGA56_01535 [Opitutaceae bacterium]